MRIFFVSLLTFVLLAGCDRITDPSVDSKSLHRSVTVEGIEFSAEIPSTIFSLYETLFISFKIRNNSSFSKEFNFSNMQQLAFELVNGNNQVVMSYPYIVSPALSEFIVNPGETKELSQRSVFKNQSGRYIEKGYYKLNVFLMNGNSPKIGLVIFVN